MSSIEQPSADRTPVCRSADLRQTLVALRASLADLPRDNHGRPTGCDPSTILAMAQQIKILAEALRSR